MKSTGCVLDLSVEGMWRSLACLVLLIAMMSEASARLPSQAPMSTPMYSHITNDKDVMVGEVWRIFQDSQGFMWFGGRKSLLKHDGFELNAYTMTTDGVYPINGVRGIAEDRHQRIWLGTRDGIFVVVGHTDVITKYYPSNVLNYDLDSLFVRHLLIGPDQNLYIASDDGLFIIDTASLTFDDSKPINLRRITTDNSLLTSNNIKTLYIDPSDKTSLWIGSDIGLDRLDIAASSVHEPKKITRYQPIPVTSEGVNENFIRTISHGKKGHLWLGTNKGLIDFNYETQKSIRYQHSEDDVESIASNDIPVLLTDNTGHLWVGTDGHGLSRSLSTDNTRFQSFMPSVGHPYSILSHTIRSIYQDRDGDLWIGYYPSGISYFDRFSDYTTLYVHQPSHTASLSHSSVTSIKEDEDGLLWVATDGGGINLFDRNTGTAKHFTADKNQPDRLSSNLVTSLLIDSEGIIWAGTWAGGVVKIDPATHHVTGIPFEHNVVSRETMTQSSQLNSQNIWHLSEDSRGDIWVATHNAGLSRYNKKSNKFTHYWSIDGDDSSLLSPLVWMTFEDRQHNFWVGSLKGLQKLNRETGRFSTHMASAGRLSINAILEDSQSRLWVASEKGIYRYFPHNDTYKHYSKEQGLTENTITSLTEDRQGDIWLGTNNGYIKFSPDQETFKTYGRISGQFIGKINRNASLTDSRGDILFGSVNGLRILTPSKLTFNTKPPQIRFLDLRINSRKILPNDKSGILKEPLDKTKRIVLGHTQNILEVSFTALNYKDFSRNRYAYMLEGFDDSWNYLENQRIARYTNIAPGDYIFRVKASNNEGVWNDQGRDLHITQLPAPWKTWWAYVLYTIGFLALIAIVFRQKMKVIQFEHDAQQALNRKLMRLDALKNHFLSNTSHELLTPLNGIIGLSESLAKALQPEHTSLYKQAVMISMSGKRLAGLVKDILDFSKVSNNDLELNFQKQNIHRLVNDVFSYLEPMTLTKNVALENKVDPGHEVLADKYRLENIFSNLISNAIKYSPEGIISVQSVDSDDDMILVSVVDPGIGIKEEDQAKVFIAFDQIDLNDGRLYEGAGLGLALTKKLVEAHGGTITLTSTPGEGSTFSFTLPRYQGVYDPAEPQENLGDDGLGTENVNDSTLDSCIYRHIGHYVPSHKPIAKPLNSEQHTILVVDDDPVNRMVLTGILKIHDYQIEEADSGLRALEVLRSSTRIDLVILDIMMPIMSGYDVCQAIRRTYAMHELPVIFLTAKTDDDSMIKGMELGANDFLTKPVSQAALLPKVASLLRLTASINS